jgi:hypothetical protein
VIESGSYFDSSCKLKLPVLVILKSKVTKAWNLIQCYAGSRVVPRKGNCKLTYLIDQCWTKVICRYPAMLSRNRYFTNNSVKLELDNQTRACNVDYKKMNNMYSSLLFSKRIRMTKHAQQCCLDGAQHWAQWIALILVIVGPNMWYYLIITIS